MLTSTFLACDKLCTLPLSQANEPNERLHEPKAHALNDTKFGSQPKHPCSHPQTHACRHYTSRVCVCVCVLPWLRCCCCCCRWFLLEGASCKAKLVACGCERSAPSSSVRHLPRNLRKIVTRNSRATQSAACHTVPNKGVQCVFEKEFNTIEIELKLKRHKRINPFLSLSICLPSSQGCDLCALRVIGNALIDQKK